MDGHEEFRELCAISVSGELAPDETTRLDEHLRTCSSCEKIFHQYRATVLSVVPQLAADGRSPERVAASSWDVKAAETVLFERLKTQERDELSPERFRNELAASRHLSGYVPPPARWKEFGMLYAAGIFLFLALTIVSYRLGTQHGARTATVSMANGNRTAGIVPGNEHDRLIAQLAERDKTISGLKQQIASKTSSVREVRALPAVGGPARDEKLSRNDHSISTEARMAEVEKQLAESQRIRSDELAQTAALEAKASELTEQLRERDEALGRQQSSFADANRLMQDRDKTIAEQQDLLAHDRDIRELMGSRNLYIAEVYDVAKTGQINKPFGRVFYTKGKSLIFYAYDLDQQPGVKTASSFQVWGSAANQGRAVSLGVFFEDSVANKRWVLKAEDAQSLEQIDAVFVTIEPKGGSQKPSGKPVLFASLKNLPNHP
jgi:Anti-sigma-K factor rskA/Putative zinc-finger